MTFTEERAVIDFVFGPDRPATGREGAVDPASFHAAAEKLRLEHEVAESVRRIHNDAGPASRPLAIRPALTNTNVWCGDFRSVTSDERVHVFATGSDRCHCGALPIRP